MQTRVIDYVHHEPTSRQALEMMLRYWKEDRTAPVILLSPPRRGDAIIKTIRVALSRERSHYAVNERAYYSFKCSEPFPYTVDGIKNEAIVIHWAMTQSQSMKNIIRSLDDLERESD